MAASDPATHVATPTGVLLGVAAFSWDGAAWQPSGRASPDVSTPTGALQGIAPFSWDGAAWQPSGRAGPGVATSTGVLNGVAVYTWSGSAWTPTGAQYAPSTSSGSLRGIAAFSWDGAAWQPAAQAGPSVATPYGVLTGVAIFNWSGSTWQAGAAVPAGATLDLSFLSGTLDPRITFTRASTATYFDSSGVMRTAASGAPRFDYDPVTRAARGLLIEEARTNLTNWSGDLNNAVWSKFNNISIAPVTTANQTTAPDGTVTAASIVYPVVSTAGAYSSQYQGFTGTAVPYTVSIWLRGAVGGEQTYIQLTDNTTHYSSPRVTLTTQWQRFSVTSPALTATAWYFIIGTDLRDVSQTSTPAQTIFAWGGQTEAGAFPTSYIPTTAAGATRALDDCWMPIGAWFNTSTTTLAVEFIYPRPIDSFAAHDLVTLGDNTGPAGNHMTLRATDGGGGPLLAKVNTSTTTLAPAGNPVAGAVSKLVGAFDGTTSYACLNGGAVGTLAAPVQTGIARLVLGNHNTGGTVSPLDGYIRRVRYWPRVLTNAELQSVTT